jgi:hypothetical protein
MKQLTPFFCKNCGSVESLPEVQDGIKLSQVTKVICPVCLARGKHHKMYKILKKCTI